MRNAKLIVPYLLLSAALLYGVWRWSFEEALAQQEIRAEASLSLAADRLVGRLERYRMLPVILSRDIAFLAALDAPDVPQSVQDRLRHLADLTRSLRVSLVRTDGMVVADSETSAQTSLRGQSIAGRPDFERAMNGALGFFHGVDDSESRRGFTFASPLRDMQGRIQGALVVRADLENLEFHWRGDPEIIFFVDAANVVFISNRDNLLFTRLNGNMPVTRQSTIFGRTIWHSDGRVLPRQSLLNTQPLPVIGMQAYILNDLAPVVEQAQLRTLLAAALLALIGVGFWTLQIRRTALARQLALREETNAELEARVEKRTEQLRRTQGDLVQAGKLSALGQMSAGISHELNQPLAAIQSFSENAMVFLDRGNTGKAKENLERISSLTARMARIIKNLRAFARKEGEVTGNVSLNKVVNDALEIGQSRIAAQNVRVDWQPGGEIFAQGGAVRLQQVVLNLISNAIDAMEGQADKRIWISVEQAKDTVQLRLRDNGPGLETPEKIFDPFYSTKPAHDDSMGLGLSISYGIVQSFGGAIKGENTPQGGAVFTVTLSKAKDKP